MVRSPIFMFMVVLLIAVSLVLVVALAIQRPATDPVYYNTSSQINSTQSFINLGLEATPSYLIPAIFVSLAIALIATIFLLRRR